MSTTGFGGSMTPSLGSRPSGYQVSETKPVNTNRKLSYIYYSNGSIYDSGSYIENEGTSNETYYESIWSISTIRYGYISQTTRRTYIDQVTSNTFNTYPTNGVSGSYWYVFLS